MKGWLLAAVIVVAVGVLIVRRLRGEPLLVQEVFGAPVALVVVGGFSLAKVSLTVVDVLWLALSAAIGVAFGAVRASTTVLYEREGVLWQRYTGKTFAVWVVSIVVNFGVGLLATACGMHEQARPMQLSIGLSLLGEALMIAWRARATGLPYARPKARV